MSIITEKAGRRTYFTGSTYAVKDIFRSMGAKWDRERKAWWCGNKKAELILAEIERGATKPRARTLREIANTAKPARSNGPSEAQINYALTLIRRIGWGWQDTDMGQFGPAPTASQIRGMSRSEISNFIGELKAEF